MRIVGRASEGQPTLFFLAKAIIARRPRHDLDLLFRQLVQLLHQRVDLAGTVSAPSFSVSLIQLAGLLRTYRRMAHHSRSLRIIRS